MTLFALLVACVGHVEEPEPEAPVEKPAPPPIGDPFAPTQLDPISGKEAIYVVDPVPGAKELQAGYLLFPDGETWVVSYRPDPALYPYVDKRVVVSGRPNKPSPMVQHVGSIHIELDDIRLADGETPWDPPPVELPAPPITRTVPEIAARAGRWAQIPGTPVSLAADEAWFAGVLRLEDGTEVRVVVPGIGEAAFRNHLSKPSTLLGRVAVEDGAVRVSYGAICAGEAPRCGMTGGR
jgi:hypothetical protein